jgi:hypothetical protein
MGLCLALATLGFDAKPIITAITGALVSFAFVIGTAGSNYLQGVIFILFCRPYDIGKILILLQQLESFHFNSRVPPPSLRLKVVLFNRRCLVQVIVCAFTSRQIQWTTMVHPVAVTLWRKSICLQQLFVWHHLEVKLPSAMESLPVQRL